MPRRCSACSGIQNDFDASVLLVVEDFVGARSVAERQAVRDHERGIDLAALDAIEQGPDIFLHVRLSHLEREAFAERGADGEFIDRKSVDRKEHTSELQSLAYL